MLTRLADFLLTKVGRVVFLLTSIVLFCFTILLIEYFADSRSIWAFDCKSKMYHLKNENNLPVNHQQESLYLSLTIQDKLINLDYYTDKKIDEREFVSLKGRIKELDIGKLMYQLDLKVTDVDFKRDGSQLQEHLANELNEVKAELVQDSHVSVAVQVLEMDAKKDYILIKFTPYNTLWACRLHD